MGRDLKYWKGRKVQIRESIIEMVKAYEFAEKKENQCEKLILLKK